MPAFVRLGTAAFVADNLKNFRKRPSEPIELYEVEGCPFCRKVRIPRTCCCAAVGIVLDHDTQQIPLLQVREACTLLDIDVLFYPCPKGGPTWRPKVQSEVIPHCNDLSKQLTVTSLSQCLQMQFLHSADVTTALPSATPCICRLLLSQIAFRQHQVCLHDDSTANDCNVISFEAAAWTVFCRLYS